MALLFVLNKKLEGGISSSGIEVKSLANRILGPGVPIPDCREVSVEIGLPISVNCFPSTVCEVLAGVTIIKEVLFVYVLEVSQIEPLSAAVDILPARFLIFL
jgi:hypothetical protein